MSRMLPWIARVGVAYGRKLLRGVGASAARIIGEIEPPRRPLRTMQGEAKLGSRVVIFCHFNPHGRLLEHVRRYIIALIEAELSVVFVTNSGRLDQDATDWLRPRCAWIIIRRNTGFDFAAWRDGLAVAQLPAPETKFLLFVNDSVYGPLSPLGPLLARMDFSAADVWGLTDSWQSRFHLQSYLLAFGANALHHVAFTKFWAHVRDLRSKEAVVQAYEIGLTQMLLDAGLTCEALWPYVNMVARLHASQTEVFSNNPIDEVRQQAEWHILSAAARRVPLNPTAELWRLLLISGFPFLKRELLRNNPAYVVDVAAWLDLTRAVSPVEAEVILRDLRGSLRKTAP